MTLLLALTTTLVNIKNFDLIMLYSKLPYNCIVINTIYWMSTMLFMFVLQMTWSWLLTIPGCLAFQYECLLKSMTAHLKSSGNFRNDRTKVLEYYFNLEYMTRLLFGQGFSRALICLYFLVGLQQTITSFFIFNVIRNGGGWEEIQVLFFDLVVSL